jgi:hypothetical protein
MPDTKFPSDGGARARFLAAGITIPAERAKGAIEEADRILAVQFSLRGPRSAAAEPSNIFTLKPGAE